MTTIKLIVTGASARAEVYGLLTSGMVGIPVEIAYDSAWDGLTKSMVCRAGGIARTILNVENSATVAHECMIANATLCIGVEGRNADGTLVIPTVWAKCGVISPGANADDDPSADPTLPVWAQIQAMIGNLDDLETEAKNNLVDAVNEAMTKGGGTVDPAAIAAAVAEYIRNNPISETDPTVPAWAKAAEKPAYTAAEVGAISQEDLQAATDAALSQAKESGLFDGEKGDPGTDGKSAYQYAQDGGYTGTEAEFAERLAMEIPVVDGTLKQSGKAADAAVVGEKFRELSEEIKNLQTSVLTTAQVNALDGMFKVCAFTKADISAEYNAFKTAFGITDSGGDSGGDDSGDGGETDVTLTSISATYSGGDVAVGTAVTDLTGIVVTAHYSDGTSETVTGYTLDGTIADGENSVTVTYQGKTATFAVTGTAESGGDEPGGESGVSNETTWSDGVPYTYRAIYNSYIEADGTITEYNGWNRTPYMYCKGVTKLRLVVNNTSGMFAPSADYSAFYDSEKEFIEIFGFSDMDGNTLGTTKDIDVPANAEYFIISGKAGVVGCRNEADEAAEQHDGYYAGFIPYA